MFHLRSEIVDFYPAIGISFCSRNAVWLGLLAGQIRKAILLILRSCGCGSFYFGFNERGGGGLMLEYYGRTLRGVKLCPRRIVVVFSVSRALADEAVISLIHPMAMAIVVQIAHFTKLMTDLTVMVDTV